MDFPREILTSFGTFLSEGGIMAGGQRWALPGTDERFGRCMFKVHYLNVSLYELEYEKQLLQKIGSRKTPEIFDFGKLEVKGETFYWSLEKQMNGTSLREYAKMQRYGLSMMRNMLIEALAVLVILEAHRVVHRDIKPDNILVDDAFRVKLVDFGHAWDMDNKPLIALSEGRFGAAGYAPPEQFEFRDADVDSRSDLFSLGVTLMELALGYHPLRFPGEDDQTILDLMQQRLAKVSLPRETEQINDSLYAMTQWHPGERPNSAQQVLRILNQI